MLPAHPLCRVAMSTRFTPSNLSFSDEEQLKKALKRLRVSSRRLEVALEEGQALPPPWARAAILKASIAVYQIAKMVGGKKKTSARKKPLKKEKKP